MHNSETICFLIAILVIVLLFVLFKCKLDCSGEEKFTTGTKDKPLIEGYERSCLGNDCYGLQRTPVDYVQKHPHGWQRNPHWKANPSSKYQPLEFGPIDLTADATRLAKGELFKQYGNNWKGCGKQDGTLVNDSKNRFDLTAVGDNGARQQLNNLYNPRFGPRGITHTEQSYVEPNPFFGKLYGGAGWLVSDVLGD